MKYKNNSMYCGMYIKLLIGKPSVIVKPTLNKKTKIIKSISIYISIYLLVSRNLEILLQNDTNVF